MQDRIDSRVLHEEHTAPCGVDFSALNTVKKNFVQLQAGHANLIFGMIFNLRKRNDSQ